MTPTQTPTQDFKKWILFNNSLADHKKLYDFYKAVKDVKAASETRCTTVRENEITKYLIECSSVADRLEIGEEGRQHLLAYLQQHYFHTDNIDEWFRTKQSQYDKKNNHQYLPEEKPTFGVGKAEPKIEPHGKETMYYNLKLLFSGLGYLVLFTLLTVAFLKSPVQAVIYLVAIVIGVLLFVVMEGIAKGFFVGLMKGNAVRISAKQYPLIFQIVSEQAKQLRLKEIPEIYVYDGPFNAFVMKFARAKVLMLYSQVVETAMTGDDSILRFVIGHELGHIHRKHLTKSRWLIFSIFIPFLNKAYSRGCEYTCDRIGYHFSQKGAIEGVLILATGKEIYSKINVDHFVDDAVNSGSFWMWFSEKFLSHPHTAKRLNELRKYAQHV